MKSLFSALFYWESVSIFMDQRFMEPRNNKTLLTDSYIERSHSLSIEPYFYYKQGFTSEKVILLLDSAPIN